MGAEEGLVGAQVARLVGGQEGAVAVVQRVGVDLRDARAQQRPHEELEPLQLRLLDDQPEGGLRVGGCRGLVFDERDL